MRLLPARADGVRLGVRERAPERGEMERRGEERSRGEGGLAAVGVWERVRERPRSGDGEAIQRASGE